MKPNDWQDTIAMAASAIEDLLETADEQAGCWVDVPAKLRALTAPPAPAVVKLPTEFHSDEGIMVRLEQVMAALALVGVKYERRGDACRAAMLAQPASQGYKLVPVEPTEEMIAAAMNCDDVEFNSDETFCVNFDNIYRAMLAASVMGNQ